MLLLCLLKRLLMNYVEWIEQHLLITDWLAIDEPMNMKMCNKWEKVLKSGEHLTILKKKSVIMSVFRTYTLSQVLGFSLRTKQLQNNFNISAFSALLFSSGYHHVTYTLTAVSFDLSAIRIICPRPLLALFGASKHHSQIREF